MIRNKMLTHRSSRHNGSPTKTRCEIFTIIRTVLGSRIISVQSFRCFSYFSCSNRKSVPILTIARPDFFLHSVHCFIVDNCIYTIQKTSHIPPNQSRHFKVMACNTSVFSDEHIERTLLEAQFVLWCVLDLIYVLERQYHYFTGMMMKLEWAVRVLSNISLFAFWDHSGIFVTTYLFGSTCQQFSIVSIFGQFYQWYVNFSRTNQLRDLEGQKVFGPFKKSLEKVADQRVQIRRGYRQDGDTDR
jgi:hypothetical protein